MLQKHLPLKLRSAKVVLPQSQGKFKLIPLAKHGSLLGSLAIRIHVVPTKNVLLVVL